MIQNASSRVWDGGALSVLSFNMLFAEPKFLGGGVPLADETLPARTGFLADEILKSRPDVILLQEVSAYGEAGHCNVLASLMDRLAAGGLSYNAIYFRAHGFPALYPFDEGEAILSSFEITSAEQWVFGSQASFGPFSEHRSAMRATLRGSRGDFDVINMHLHAAGNETTDAQARELATRLIPALGTVKPIIVGGDLNAGPDSPAVRSLLDAGFVDTWQRANGDRPGFTYGNQRLRDPSTQRTKRIDYLFVKRGRVLSSELFLSEAASVGSGQALWASDHSGVLSRLALLTSDQPDPKGPTN